MTSGAIFTGRDSRGWIPTTESFRVEVSIGNAIVVAPIGELDMLTVDELEDKLRQAFDRDCRHVTLDLRGLTFMDSQGLHLVKSWSSRAERSGVGFAVVQGGAAVRRLFEIVGLLDKLPFVDSIGDGPAPDLTSTGLQA